MAKTERDELAEKTKAKIIELFGPESALAQAMEDEEFMKKLAQLVAWLYGEIMLSQPRPQYPISKPTPEYPKAPPTYPGWQRHLIKREWGEKWQAATADSPFAHKLWSAMTKYERR